MGFAEWSKQKYGRADKAGEQKTFREAISGVKEKEQPPPKRGLVFPVKAKQEKMRASNQRVENLISQRGALVRAVKNKQYASLAEAEAAMGFGSLQGLNQRVKVASSDYEAARKTPTDMRAYAERVTYLKDPSRRLSREEQQEAKEIAAAYQADLRRLPLAQKRTKEDLQRMADVAALEAKYKGGTQFGLGFLKSFGAEAANKKVEQALPSFVRDAVPSAPNLYQSAQKQAPIASGAGLLLGEGVKYVSAAKALGAIPKVGEALRSGSMVKRIAAASAVDLPMDLASAALYSDGDKKEFGKQLGINVAFGVGAGTGIELIGKGIRSAKAAKAARASDAAAVDAATPAPTGAGGLAGGEVEALALPPSRVHASPEGDAVRGLIPDYPLVNGRRVLQNDGRPIKPAAPSIRDMFPDMPTQDYQIPKIEMPKNLFLDESGAELPLSKFSSAIQKYLNRVFKGKVLQVGKDNRVYVGKDGVREFSFPAKRLDPDIKKAKFTAGAQLDSTLAPAVYLNNVADDGRHAKASGGWDNFYVMFETENGVYSGVVKTMSTDKGREFYDITEIRKEAALATYGDSGTSPKPAMQNAPSFEGSIPRADANIKANSADASGAYGGNTVGAAEAGFDPYTRLVNEHGGIAAGENPARVYDVPRRNLQGQPISQAARTLAEASVTDDAALVQFEKMLLDGAFVRETVTDKSAMKAAVDTIEQEGFDGAVSAWNSAMKKRHIAKEDIALGQVLYNQAVQNKDARLVQKMIADLVLVGSESGRNLQAQRMLKKLTPDGKLYGLEQSVSRVNRDLLERYGKAHADIAIPEELAAKLLHAEDGKAADAAVSEIQQYIADRIPATFIDKWNAWRYLSMLGNPRTHIRNMVGNAAFYVAVKTKNLIAGGIERGVNGVLHLAGREGIARSKGLNFDKATRDFAKNDFFEVESILRSGGKHNPSDSIQDKRRIFNTNWLEGWRKRNTGALEWEDGLFLKLNYRQSLASYMNANKLTPSFLQNGTKEAYEALAKARDYAIMEAQKATFRDASALASALSRGKQTLARGNIGMKTGGVLAEGAIPFVKTPINILKRGAEYSPLGLLDGIKKAAFDVRAGKATAAEAIDRMAAGLTGSGVMALGLYCAAQGFVSGGKEESGGDETLRRMQGAQKYALQLGDKSYTIDWLAPMALPFFVGVEVNKLRQEDRTHSLTDYINALTNIAEPMTELSLLQSINRTIKAARYGESPGTDMLLELGTSYFGQGVPTLLGQTARTIDPLRRSIFIDKNSQVPEFLQRFGQKQAAKTPGLSMLLPASVNQWGEEQTNAGEGMAGRAAFNFLSPGYLAKDTSGAVEDALGVLYARTGDDGILPQSPEKNFKLDGATKHLSANSYTRYAKERGQKSKQILDELISLPQYAKLSDAEKVEAIKDAYQYSDAVAKSKVSDYKLNEQMQKIRDAEERGVSPAKYAAAYSAQKDIEADKDKAGEAISGTGKVNKREAIDKASPNMLFSKREILYQAMGVGLTEAEEKNWGNQEVRDAVGSKENYYKIQELVSTIKADKDEYGRSISGTAKEKEVAAIAKTLQVSTQKAREVYTKTITYKYDLKELPSKDQEAFQALSKDRMSEKSFIKYRNAIRTAQGIKGANGKTISGSLKNAKYQKLVNAGLSPAQARRFLTVLDESKW